MAGRELDMHLHLLDRQVVDPDEHLVCKVDDLEIEIDDSGHPLVTAILVGPGALGPRLGGRLGRWMVSIARRISDEEIPRRIGWEHVTDIGSAIKVNATASDLHVDALENWVEKYVISRIPGSGHASS
jgi:hypothetical protein